MNFVFVNALVVHLMTHSLHGIKKFCFISVGQTQVVNLFFFFFTHLLRSSIVQFNESVKGINPQLNQTFCVLLRLVTQKKNEIELFLFEKSNSK